MQADGEIARLRAENRALLNSILGIAGLPPLPATEADLAAVQSSSHAAASISSVGARHAVPERDAWQAADHSSQNEIADDGFRTAGLRPAPLPSAQNQNSKTPAGGRRYTNHGDPTTEANGTIQPSSIAGHGSAVPLLPDARANDFRTAGVQPALLVATQPPAARAISHSRPRANPAPHVAAPTRRRSWPQIHRLLEFESAQKEKPAADPLPPAHQ